MKNSKNQAIAEVKSLQKKIHLYSIDNKYYVEKRIEELVKKHKIVYGDLWNNIHKG